MAVFSYILPDMSLMSTIDSMTSSRIYRKEALKFRASINRNFVIVGVSFECCPTPEHCIYS